MRNVILLFFALLFICSCHIEKRRYLPGYSSSWSIGFGKGHQKKVQDQESVVFNQEDSKMDTTSATVQMELLDTVNTANSTYTIENKENEKEARNEKLQTQSKKASKSISKIESLTLQPALAEQVHYGSENRLEAFGTHGNTDLETLLLVILAIIAPPLAVLIETGLSKAFWIDLILALVSGSFLFGIGLPLIQGLAGLSAIILALLVIFHRNPIPSAVSEVKPSRRPDGIPWTAFIIPPLALRWLEGVKKGEVVLAWFLTIFLNYIGYIYVMSLVSKYPVKRLTEEQRRIMRLNGLAIFFAIIGAIASLIYVTLYTNLFN
jgi:uncharacterized membrane protein YqaE (UPF0057 family)